MKYTIRFSTLFFLLVSQGLFAQWPANDSIFHKQVRTVLLYPQGSGQVNQQAWPILQTGSQQNLTLRFDYLGDNPQQLYYRIDHYNADWTKSRYSDIDILKQINEFYIDNYEFSANTLIPYIHYWANIEIPTKSGNYLLTVYPNNRDNTPLLTRRFYVVDNLVSVGGNAQFAMDVALRNTHQQIDFKVWYPDYYLQNPTRTVKVVISQNGRSDREIRNLTPLHFDETAKTLDFTFFNNENIFEAGREFRSFDARSAVFARGNIEKLINNRDTTQMLVFADLDLATRSYTRNLDIDGQYIIETADFDGVNTSADYVNINLRLRTDRPTTNRLAVLGRFSDYKPIGNLIYNHEAKIYTGNIFVKQGYYNYRYVTVDPTGKPDESYYDGNFSQTQNRYMIFVYYKPIGAIADQLIGHTIINAFAN